MEDLTLLSEAQKQLQEDARVAALKKSMCDVNRLMLARGQICAYVAVAEENKRKKHEEMLKAAAAAQRLRKLEEEQMRLAAIPASASSADIAAGSPAAKSDTPAEEPAGSGVSTVTSPAPVTVDEEVTYGMRTSIAEFVRVQSLTLRVPLYDFVVRTTWSTTKNGRVVMNHKKGEDTTVSV